MLSQGTDRTPGGLYIAMREILPVTAREVERAGLRCGLFRSSVADYHRRVHKETCGDWLARAEPPPSCPVDRAAVRSIGTSHDRADLVERSVSGKVRHGEGLTPGVFMQGDALRRLNAPLK